MLDWILIMPSAFFIIFLRLYFCCAEFFFTEQKNGLAIVCQHRAGYWKNVRNKSWCTAELSTGRETASFFNFPLISYLSALIYIFLKMTFSVKMSGEEKNKYKMCIPNELQDPISYITYIHIFEI